MNESAPEPTADEFLAHSAWVRTLARHLLDDAGEADDVVQDAWVVFRKQPDGGVRNVRGWLAGVVRRLALQRHERRARQRVVQAELEELAPSPDSVRESEDGRRLVVEAVLALDEPYRSTLLLRYYQDVSAEEIARRLGVPGSTVRNRLQRGLKQVKQRLGDRDPRRGRDLAGLLIAVAGPASPPSPALIGTALMTGTFAKLCLGSAAAALLVPALQLRSKEPETNDAVVALTAVSASPERSASESNPVGLADPSEREPTRSAIGGNPETAQVAAARPGSKLHGRVIVVDDAGIEHARESGTLVLAVFQADKRKSVGVHVPIVDGMWTSEVEHRPGVEFRSVQLGGRDTFEAPRATPRVVGSDGYVELRVTWTGPVVVYARDAASNLDLDRVEVFLADDRSALPLAIPDLDSGKFEVRVEGRSPLTITQLTLRTAPDARAVYLRAPGYGWAFARFDRRGGDVFVELQPAASLVVELTGTWAVEPCSFRLSRSAKERPLFERDAVVGSRFTFDGMAAGDYRLAVESGAWAGAPFVLAEAMLSLPAGQETLIRLPVTDRDIPEFVSLSGTIRVPHAWNAQLHDLRATRCTDRRTRAAERASIAEDPPKGSDVSLYTWNFDALPVGRYVLSSNSPPFAALVDLPRGGRAGVVLEIPPPAQVALTLVDAGKHEPLPEPLRLKWAVRASECVAGMAWNSVRLDPAKHVQEFACPVGELVLSSEQACFSGYEFPERTLSVVPGRNEFTIEVPRATGLTVRCMDDKREIGLGSEDAVEIMPADGDGSSQACGTAGAGVVVARVTKPGKYRVRLKTPLPGFALPAEQVVDLEPGTMTDVVIQLTRK